MIPTPSTSMRPTATGRYTETFQPEFGGTLTGQFGTKLLDLGNHTSANLPYSWYKDSISLIAPTRARLGIGLVMKTLDAGEIRVGRFSNGIVYEVECSSTCRVTWQEPEPATFPNAPNFTPGMTAYVQSGALINIASEYYVNTNSVDILETTAPLSLSDSATVSGPNRVFSALVSVTYRGTLNMRAIDRNFVYVIGVAVHVPNNGLDVVLSDWSGMLYSRRSETTQRAVNSRAN